MCDPVSLTLASTAIGAVGSVASSVGQAKAQKKQQQEVNAWQRTQTQNRIAEQGRQEELRQQADIERVQGLEQMSGEAQAKRQSEEEARLTDYLQGQGEAANVSGTTPVAEADRAMLSGQAGGEPAFKEDLAKKINESSKDARQRIAALARVSSYGESFGGLGTTNPLIQQAASSAIDRQNEFRRGSLGAYNVERAVDPVQVTYQPSPLADVFSTALQVGTSGLGSMSAGGSSLFGKPGGGAALFGGAGKFPAAPIIAGDRWGKLRGGTVPWGQAAARGTIF